MHNWPAVQNVEWIRRVKVDPVVAVAEVESIIAPPCGTAQHTELVRALEVEISAFKLKRIGSIELIERIQILEIRNHLLVGIRPFQSCHRLIQLPLIESWKIGLILGQGIHVCSPQRVLIPTVETSNVGRAVYCPAHGAGKFECVGRPSIGRAEEICTRRCDCAGTADTHELRFVVAPASWGIR